MIADDAARRADALTAGQGRAKGQTRQRQTRQWQTRQRQTRQRQTHAARRSRHDTRRFVGIKSSLTLSGGGMISSFWPLGPLAPWPLGPLAPWPLGLLAPWPLGLLAPWASWPLGGVHDSASKSLLFTHPPHPSSSSPFGN